MSKNTDKFLSIKDTSLQGSKLPETIRNKISKSTCSRNIQITTIRNESKRSHKPEYIKSELLDDTFDPNMNSHFNEETEIIQENYNLDEKSILLSADELPQSMFMCRLCTQNILKEEMISIHEANPDDGTTLADKINACLPITVSPTDKLPKQICADCKCNLESSYIFSCSVTSAEETLQSLQQLSDCVKMNCPMCYEGSMKVMPPDVENNCSSDDSALNLINDYCFIGKQNVQKDHEEEHFSIVNSNSGLAKKRKHECLEECLSDVDGEDTGPHSSVNHHSEVKPVANRKQAHIPRGRPKGSKNKITKFKNMSCFICHFSFKNYDDALVHALNAHCDVKSLTFPCPLCQDILTSRQELSEHIDVHNDIREIVVIQCSLCGMETREASDMHRHVHDQHLGHQPLNLSCRLCKSVFTDHHHLLAHLDQQHNDTIVPCNMCTLGFGGCEEFKKHFLEIHVNRKDQMFCTECKSEFPTVSDHANHIIDKHCTTTIYRLPSSYSCYICRNNFKSQYQLVKHTCNVTFDELTCKDCSKTFPTRARLVFHLQTHQESFSMRCDECLSFFSDEDTFYDHVRFQHEPSELTKCQECGKVFKNEISLNMHMRRHQANRDHECTVCGKRFQNAQTLREHSVSHMTVKPFQCHICGAYLSRLSRLRIHLRSHSAKASKSSMKVYKCSLCHQLYPNMQNAAKHLETHSGVDNLNLDEIEVSMVFRCEFCDGCFQQTVDLNNHRSSRHPDPEAQDAYTCSICGAQFSTYARVTTHKLSHGINTETLIVPDEVDEVKEEFVIPQYFLCHECDKKCLHYTYMNLHRRFQHGAGKSIFTCTICKEKFATSWSLQCHSKKFHGVTGEEVSSDSGLFRCPECHKPYVSQAGLEQHLKRSHQPSDSTSDNFICEICGKTFILKTALDAHSDAHKGLKRYNCKSCNRKFTHRAGLIRHMKLHSDDHPFVCEFCGKKFRDRTERENHRRAHTGERPFMCDICGRTFHTRAVWLDHSRIHQDVRPYQCDICCQSFRRSYALKSHYLIHTGEKPFPCEVCGKAFRFKQSLFAHKKKDHQGVNNVQDEAVHKEALFIQEGSHYELLKSEDLADSNAEEDANLISNSVTSLVNNSTIKSAALPNRTVLKDQVSCVKPVNVEEGYSLLLKRDQSALLNVIKRSQ